jgi:Mg2+/Co2+ transporter CorC
VWREGNEISSLRSLLRPAYFVPEAKKVDELLAEMQAGACIWRLSWMNMAAWLVW